MSCDANLRMIRTMVCALIPSMLIAGCLATDPEPTPPSYDGPSFRVVRVSKPASAAQQIAVHACAGLYNRQSGGSIFVQTDTDVTQSRIDGALTRDEVWLESMGLTPSATIAADDFLNECQATFPSCVRYSYGAQQEILPAILTAAAALGAVPVAEETGLKCDSPALDATAVFADRATPLLATEYVYAHYLTDTTGLAMLNPGYDRHAEDLANPDLIEDMPVALIDFVFARRLFVTFLVNGCIEGNPERDLLTKIVEESPWKEPIGVYGYNDSWLIGGYVYEAQTDCLDTGNMGAIPSRTTNLSFFATRRAEITSAAELPAIEPERVRYDPEKTYVAFVVGDGDNIRYIMSTRRDWLAERLERCQDARPKCPALTWTISPHLPEIAPDVLVWYADAARSTGADYFALPPSGYLYAYPSMLNDENEALFAAETERTARILGTHSVIHWEWFEAWADSRAHYLPRYAHAGNQIRGIFPVNVPYIAEPFPDWPSEQMYEMLTGADGGQAALFRTRSWRGVDGRDDFHATPAEMAATLADLPKGTVTWVYMTSDGGLTLENSYFELLPLLPEHMQLVSTDTAAELAIAASAN
ncbi:MAG: hypothetical protein D6761_08145 [Candidatus Dadabacteria bacterium]|nr:MAG: hypothetical protein D6761_08145 [Candidatus Dadabacteria bacterium]